MAGPMRYSLLAVACDVDLGELVTIASSDAALFLRADGACSNDAGARATGVPLQITI